MKNESSRHWTPCCNGSGVIKTQIDSTLAYPDDPLMQTVIGYSVCIQLEGINDAPEKSLEAIKKALRDIGVI